MGFETHVGGLPYAHGGSVGAGLLRQTPENFIVNEQLTFEPSGEGEHVFLYVQKIGLNTDDIVKRLAIHAGVSRRSVSYAGMKDKHAVTKQWFSVHLPGKEGPDWLSIEDDSFKVERITRHLKKLKRGTIKFNEFKIIISQLKTDKKLLLQRADQIKKLGVPNYFMEQRFGYLCQNIDRVYGLFSRNEAIKNKKMKSLLLSSARSFLFNEVLSVRVVDNSWNTAKPGDVFMLDGTRQHFKEEVVTNVITKRLITHDIHPTGPMFGMNNNVASGAAYELEDEVFAANKIFCDGLIKEKTEFARRALRVVPEDFQFELIPDNKLELSFKLRSGSYATAVIRELITTTNSFD